MMSADHWFRISTAQKNEDGSPSYNIAFYTVFLLETPASRNTSLPVCPLSPPSQSPPPPPLQPEVTAACGDDCTCSCCEGDACPVRRIHKFRAGGLLQCNARYCASLSAFCPNPGEHNAGSIVDAHYTATPPCSGGAALGTGSGGDVSTGLIVICSVVGVLLLVVVIILIWTISSERRGMPIWMSACNPEVTNIDNMTDTCSATQSENVFSNNSGCSVQLNDKLAPSAHA